MDKYYNGHEIFSHIIPAGINSVKKSGDKITFQISNGKLFKYTSISYKQRGNMAFSKKYFLLTTRRN